MVIQHVLLDLFAVKALGDILIDELGVPGHRTGIVDPQREGIAGSEQRGDDGEQQSPSIRPCGHGAIATVLKSR